ncbi:MAG: NTP transferase domain-containing protein [Clostridia bacterium]|nr:NTP transferase domain-containing protein [Clostridia bacterium]
MSAVKPTLVIMAAGMGSRFGGLKQVTPVGPHGEKLIEYAIYDARKAGFGKVVFIIKKAIEEEFKATIGRAVEGQIPVEYVFQELDRLPDGYTIPEGREKPWGTGHAVLCCEGVVDTPFAVINADDYYGSECFRLLADFFRKPQADDGKLHVAMVGYELCNTMTENGSVSRGVCESDENHLLTSIVERTRIEWKDGVPAFTEDGDNWETLPETTTVSMNCWGFPAGALSQFKQLFVDFLEGLKTDAAANPVKAEFFLPFAVDSLMKAGIADTTVMTTPDKWYGMTYKEDHQTVIGALASMSESGKYPAPLWKA